MPHDKNGTLLEVGDVVTIEARVVSIQPQEEYCNATLLLTEFMPPYTEPNTSLTVNTKQVVKSATQFAPIQSEVIATQGDAGAAPLPAVDGADRG
jgi:hypothetical protein